MPSDLNQQRMRLLVDYKSGTPVFEQLVLQIKAAIAANLVRPGESLPAIGALSEELRVSRNSVAKAYSELESIGVIELIPDRGYCLKEHHRQLRKAVARTPDASAIEHAAEKKRRRGRAVEPHLASGLLYFILVAGIAEALQMAGATSGFRTILLTASIAALTLPLYKKIDERLVSRLFPKRAEMPKAIEQLKVELASGRDSTSFMERLAEVSATSIGARAAVVRERADVVAMVNAFPALRSARAPITSGGELLMPLFSQDEVLGVLRVSAAAGHQYDPEDLQFLAAVGEQFTAHSNQLRIRNERAESEYGFDIQRALLPREIPQPHGVSIAGAWQAAKTVGGDYYDVFALDERRLALIIADVSGKGLAAALTMSNVQATTRAYAMFIASPAELCSRVNRATAANISTGRFVTFFFAILDTVALTLTYCNAGHNPPLVVAPGSTVRRMEAGGPVLGILPDAPYQEEVIQLGGLEKIVLFTDGILEAESAEGEEFGEERLLERIEADKACTAKQLLDSVMEAVTLYCGGNFSDDATLLTIVLHRDSHA